MPWAYANNNMKNLNSQKYNVRQKSCNGLYFNAGSTILIGKADEDRVCVHEDSMYFNMILIICVYK